MKPYKLAALAIEIAGWKSGLAGGPPARRDTLQLRMNFRNNFYVVIKIFYLSTVI